MPTGTFTSNPKQVTATITWEMKNGQAVFTGYSVSGLNSNPKYPNQGSNGPNGINISGLTNPDGSLSFAMATLNDKTMTQVFACGAGGGKAGNNFQWLGEDGGNYSEDFCDYSVS